MALILQLIYIIPNRIQLVNTRGVHAMAEKVWFGNDRWPSGRNLGEFAKDIFRIEHCKTDRDKALTFYKWIIRCFMRGPNFQVPDGFGTYSRSFDPIKMLTSFGHFECTGWGWVPAEALQAAGLKARRVVGQNDGHTIYEVFYKGLDGKEGWHAFDAFIGWYFLNRSGEVASCEELTADPNLVHDPVGQAVPNTYNVDMAFLPKRHDWGDALDIIQHVKNETLSYDIKPGMEYANLFEPADPSKILYCGENYPRGSHCHIVEFDHTGAVLYPEHEPYWHNYRHNFHDTSWEGSERPARSHGAGALRWNPLLYGKNATAWADYACFENNRVRPDGRNKHCEIWYEFKLPYFVSYLQVEGFARVSGSDYMGVGISSDNGKTIAPLKTDIKGNFRFLNGPEDFKARKTSVQYTTHFHVRIDMHGHGAILPTLESLRFTVGYQHNMFTQPFLLPGKNRIWLEGAALSDAALSARWNYTCKGDAGCCEVMLAKEGRAEKEIILPIEKQEDLTLRGVVLTSWMKPLNGR